MTTLQRRVLEDLIGSTGSLVDRHRQFAALLYARSQGIESDFRVMLMAKRFAWLNWLTVTQRQWQGQTRNANKARHHDSISIREKYVRVTL